MYINEKEDSMARLGLRAFTFLRVSAIVATRLGSQSRRRLFLEKRSIYLHDLCVCSYIKEPLVLFKKRVIQ